ncbi:MAG: DUF1616 domain-containing protein [Candidatus Thermoplasmatota archaeon]
MTPKERSQLLSNLLEGRRYPTDLLIALLWAALAVVGALRLPAGDPARVALGIPLIIFIPGYLLVSALWPRMYVKRTAEDMEEIKGTSPDTSIDNLERIALSFGLSIAIVPLIGLVLNYTWNISLVPVLISLFGFVVAMTGIAWYTRAKVPEKERFFISFHLNLRPTQGEWTRADKLATAALAISLITAGGALAYVIITPAEGERFTEFYILDQNHTLNNLPTNLSVNETGTIIIGVVCHEYERTNYTVVIRLLNMTGERQNITLGSYNLVLNHEEKNETLYTFWINATGEYKLEIELYKANDLARIYMDCHLWVKVNEAA